MQLPDSYKKKIFSDFLLKVVYLVFEGEEFPYRCLNDVSARHSRKKEQLFPKNMRSYVLTYSLEKNFFLKFCYCYIVEEGPNPAEN